jgi:hypothetical protein
MADNNMGGSTTSTTSSANKEMDLNKVKELHSNVRHITQLAMTWFAFLVTTNYLTIGWLAKGSSDGSKIVVPDIVPTIARVFIVQNGLGMFGLAWVLMATWAMEKQVNTLENPPQLYLIPHVKVSQSGSIT